MNERHDLEEALELIRTHYAARFDAHGVARGALCPREAIEIPIEIPAGSEHDSIRSAAADFDEKLEAAVKEAYARHEVFRAGHAFCFRCGSSQCSHSLPPSPREIVVGYTSSGMPRFLDFAQFVLDRRDPRVEKLYAGNPGLVTVVQSEAELCEDIVQAVRRDRAFLRVNGQVSAGWFRFRRDRGFESVAVAFQIITIETDHGRLRHELHLVGRGPGGCEITRVHGEQNPAPWADALTWARSVLERIGAGSRASGHRERRLLGVLGGLARRLEHRDRSRSRRTLHAEKRHQTGIRPTEMALEDLRRAHPESFRIDRRQNTLVVLGDRGRVHIFNRHGKLVTSVRYPARTIAKRCKTGLWRPASAEELAPVAEIFASERSDEERTR